MICPVPFSVPSDPVPLCPPQSSPPSHPKSYDFVSVHNPLFENIAMHTQPECPDKVLVHSPVEVSQTLGVASFEAVNTEEPSAENLAVRT